MFAELEPYLERLSSLQSLERWRDEIIRGLRDRYSHGDRRGDDARRPAGPSGTDRNVSTAEVRQWHFYLSAGLSRMRESGMLRADADPTDLAMAIIAAVQGGYILAQTARSEKPMAIALDMAIDHVRAFAQ